MGGMRDRGRNGGTWAAQQGRKDQLLSADERRMAMELRRKRFSPQAIAKSIGRSVEDVRAFLASPEAGHV